MLLYYRHIYYIKQLPFPREIVTEQSPDPLRASDPMTLLNPANSIGLPEDTIHSLIPLHSKYKITKLEL